MGYLFGRARSGEFEGQGQRSKVKATRDKKTTFFGLSGGLRVRFMFGKTSLASSVYNRILILEIHFRICIVSFTHTEFFLKFYCTIFTHEDFNNKPMPIVSGITAALIHSAILFHGGFFWF